MHRHRRLQARINKLRSEKLAVHTATQLQEVGGLLHLLLLLMHLPLLPRWSPPAPPPA